MLSPNFNQPIELVRNKQYGLCLHGFYSHNSIFNIHDSNNVSVCNSRQPINIEISPRSYEIDEINKAIQSIINSELGVNKDVGLMFSLIANKNTFKLKISSLMSK